MKEEDRLYLIKTRCETDVALFAAFFFPEYCERPFSIMHLELFEQCSDLRRNQKRCIAAPRGNAKSTIVTLIKVVHRIVYNLEHFIVIISDTEKQARDRLTDIKTELEHNELLKAVYGELRSPYWNKEDIITTNDIRVMCFATRSQIRGIRHKQWRPTWIIYDDVENRKAVRSPEQRMDTADWMRKDTLRAGITGYTNFDFLGTMLHSDSLLANLMKNPGWKRKLYRSVIKWPTGRAWALWEEWKRIYTDLAKDDRQELAEAFYFEHEEEMLEGVEVLWPDYEPFYALMQMIVDEGKSSFNTEKQNNPVNADMAVFDMDRALRFSFSDDGKFIVRDDGRWVNLSSCDFYGYLDPAFGKTVHGDFGAIVVVAVDGYGYVYVVDVWMKKEPTSKQIQAAFEMHAKWGLTAFGLETNNGWELLKDDFADAARMRRKNGEVWDLKLVAVTNTASKEDRISTLEPKLDNRWVGFFTGLSPEFIEQMEQFPTHANDDGPDALEGAVRVAASRQTLFGGAKLDKAA